MTLFAFCDGKEAAIFGGWASGGAVYLYVSVSGSHYLVFAATINDAGLIEERPGGPQHTQPPGHQGWTQAF